MSPTVAVYVTLGLRHALGWVFFVSSADKLLHLKSFREDLLKYPGVRPRLVPALSVLIPMAEGFLALNLLAGLYWRIAALGIAALLILFTVVVTVAIVTGNRESCGCGGFVPTKSLGPLHVLINLIMLGSAGTLAWLTQTTASLPTPFGSILLQQNTQGLDAPSYLILMTVLLGLLCLAIAGAIAEVRSRRITVDEAVFGE